MEETVLTYKLEKFEGPLDLLLTLIHRNKVQIEDIPISLICDQYFAYLNAAERMDMELAVEFLVMASELMLIKSKMLLPREEPEEDDPRAKLAEAIARLAAAKKAAAALGERFARFGGRMVKDTDEISVDKTYVTDQDPDRLYEVMRRMLSEARNTENKADRLVRPIVARPVVPVQLKILGIMKHFDETHPDSTLGDLLCDAESRPDLIAIFIGVLELIKMKRLLLVENPEDFIELRGAETKFIVNPDFSGDPTEGIEFD